MSTEPTPSKEPILVPVDFSSSSEQALAWAARLAGRTGTPLVVLHVVHDPAEAPGYYLRAQASDDEPENRALRPLREAAEIMLGQFLEEARQRHPTLREIEVRTELVVGVPTRRILEVAEALGAGLIVMGSQGRTGLPRALLGSKAEQIVRLAPIPVTIVKRQREDRDP